MHTGTHDACMFAKRLGLGVALGATHCIRFKMLHGYSQLSGNFSPGLGCRGRGKEFTSIGCQTARRSDSDRYPVMTVFSDRDTLISYHGTGFILNLIAKMLPYSYWKCFVLILLLILYFGLDHLTKLES